MSNFGLIFTRCRYSEIFHCTKRPFSTHRCRSGQPQSLRSECKKTHVCGGDWGHLVHGSLFLTLPIPGDPLQGGGAFSDLIFCSVDFTTNIRKSQSGHHCEIDLHRPTDHVRFNSFLTHLSKFLTTYINGEPPHTVGLLSSICREGDVAQMLEHLTASPFMHASRFRAPLFPYGIFRETSLFLPPQSD